MLHFAQLWLILLFGVLDDDFAGYGERGLTSDRENMLREEISVMRLRRPWTRRGFNFGNE